MKLKANIKKVTVVEGRAVDEIFFFMSDEESQEILRGNTHFGTLTFKVDMPRGEHQNFLRRFGVKEYYLVSVELGERKKVRLVERKQDG